MQSSSRTWVFWTISLSQQAWMLTFVKQILPGTWWNHHYTLALRQEYISTFSLYQVAITLAIISRYLGMWYKPAAKMNHRRLPCVDSTKASDWLSGAHGSSHRPEPLSEMHGTSISVVVLCLMNIWCLQSCDYVGAGKRNRKEMQGSSTVFSSFRHWFRANTTTFWTSDEEGTLTIFFSLLDTWETDCYSLSSLWMLTEFIPKTVQRV